jgi:RHS repeat-associated protein
MYNEATRQYINLNSTPDRPEADGFSNQYELNTKDGTKYIINATTGDLETVTDSNGNTLTYSDTEIVSSSGTKITFERDAQGRITSVTDPAGAKVVYEYDNHGDGKVLTVTSASGEKITNVYDSDGKITSQTVTNAAGTTTGTTTSTYDTSGNVATLTNSAGTTGYLYDSNGYVSQITSANGSIISYLRDTQGNILQQTEKANANAIGLVTQYRYDIFGKLLTVTDSRNRVTTMTYDLVNRLETKTLPNGVKTTYGYDDLDRITSIVYAKADGTVLASETYTRNLGGEPNKVLREDGSYTLYEYDAAVRLSKETSYTAADVAVKSIVYSYDLDGKRTRKVSNLGTQDYAYNANGQLATAGANGYGYDVDGRLNTVTKAGSTVTLDHDAYDHLTQVTSNGVTTQYRYDAEGNRIGEVSTNGSKNYLVAPNLGNGLASTDLVTDGSGNVVSDYVYGGSSIIARLDANGEPLYYLTDSMGSVIGLVDGAGNIQSRIVYDGFGNVLSGDDGSSQGGDFRFQGQWLEGESGLYYMRARDYDSQTGLFLSRDAVDVQQQGVEAFNPYQFAYNNPLVFSDPSGLFTLIEVNASLSTKDILEGFKNRAYNEALDLVKQKTSESFGNLISGTLKRLMPGGLEGDELSKWTQGGFTDYSGNLFENFLVGAFCNIVGGVLQGSSFLNWLWVTPEISKTGEPIDNGTNCSVGLSASPQSASNGKKNQPINPDFLFKNGRPVEDKNDNFSSFLIGDFKISLDKALSEVRTGSDQWTAMSNYAIKHSATRMVLYTTFVRHWNNKLSDQQIKDAIAEILKKETIKKGVIVFFANLYD